MHSAVPNASFPEVHGLRLEKYKKPPFQIPEGVAAASERPGDGVDLQWHRLEENGVPQ